MSDNIDFAMGVAKETQNCDENELAVLEIETKFLTPSRTHNYLRKADPSNPNALESIDLHEVHYESSIPPDAIKILKRKKNDA